MGHPGVSGGQVAGQRPRAVGGPAYRESANRYSRGQRIREIPRGNPDAKSEPSIRWDVCQEYGGSQGLAYRGSKGRMDIDIINPETPTRGMVAVT